MSACAVSCGDRRSRPYQATSKILPERSCKGSRGLRRTAVTRCLLITSIATQYEENKTLVPSTLQEHRKERNAQANEKGPGRNRGPMMRIWKAKRLLVGALLERGAENVAQRRPRIRGAILRNGLLLFGDFQRLDRDLHLAGFLVELDHPRIDLFTDGEPLGALIGTLARELRALDEGGEVGAGDLDLDAAFLHFEHFASHDRALLDIAGLGEGIAFELLD